MGAIGSLQQQYDRPQLIHQVHVGAILEAPSLRNGSDQVLHQLCNVVKLHMRALEAMKYDSLETLISSVIELKLER